MKLFKKEKLGERKIVDEGNSKFINVNRVINRLVNDYTKQFKLLQNSKTEIAT